MIAKLTNLQTIKSVKLTDNHYKSSAIQSYDKSTVNWNSQLGFEVSRISQTKAKDSNERIENKCPIQT